MEDLQKFIPSHSFTSWFLPLNPVYFNERALRISAPSRFHSEYVEMHYRDVLKKSIKSVFGRELLVQFIIAENTAKNFVSENPSRRDPSTREK